MSVMGVLAFGEDAKIVDKVLFQKDALGVAEKLAVVESGRAINEITVLVQRLREKGYKTFVFESPELAQAVREEMGVEAEVEAQSTIGKAVQEDLERYAVEAGFVEMPLDILRWVHDISMEMSRLKVRKATEKRDLLVVQAIQALDDLDKTVNLFMNRIREWYGLHFPELDRLVEKHEIYARLVDNLGTRDNFTEERLTEQNLPKSKVSQLVKAAEESMGADFYDADMKQIQMLCRDALELYNARASLEKYIGEIMSQVAPNTSVLTGATLGARLIALAGGLSNLAKMPASTMQVLGAEKALFRSLTTGARPPKHGILFQHTLIHGAKRWVRGKIARAFAGKLAIAVRTDAFSGNYIGDRLKEDLDQRVEEINRKYAQPKSKPYVVKPTKPLRVSGEPRKRRKKYGQKG